MHHIMILKSFYKFETLFQHVSVVATNIIRESLLYNLKHCSMKNCLSYAHTQSHFDVNVYIFWSKIFSPTYLVVPNGGISPEWLIFGVFV